MYHTFCGLLIFWFCGIVSFAKCSENFLHSPLRLLSNSKLHTFTVFIAGSVCLCLNTKKRESGKLLLFFENKFSPICKKLLISDYAIKEYFFI